MAVINIRHVLRRKGEDQERDEIAGDILMPPGRTTYAVGSFQLRRIEAIQFTPRTKGFMAWGSIGSPYLNSGFGNQIVITPYYAGTTGTRLISLAKIGSAVSTGSSAFYFIAHGQ